MEVVREHMYEMDAEAVANIPISHVAQPERMEEKERTWEELSWNSLPGS